VDGGELTLMTKTPNRGEYSGLGCVATIARSIKETTSDSHAVYLIGVE
jgi:hypothetical protein